MFLSRALRIPALLSVSFLAGCGLPLTRTVSVTPSAGVTGSVHGGQQPVVGASIQLYAVGTSGDGSTATPLLAQPAVTGSGGNFSITGMYNCGNATQVYLVATGGNPGLSTTNPNLAEMTALGSCSSLSASTYVSINELTTVAATYAFAPYMTGVAAVGSGANDAGQLASAFAYAQQLVDPTTGTTPGIGVPAGMSVPTVELNTLSNILSTCINTAGGTSGDGSGCGSLFSLTTPSGRTAPTNTIASLMLLAQNPTLNTSALFNLAPASGPFQPQLSSPPPDFTVALQPSVLYFSTNNLSYTTSPIGGPSAAQSVQITNISNNPIAIAGFVVMGQASGDYYQTNNCPASLAKAASCTVQVTFQPTATGTRNAVLAVNYSNTSASVSLSGTGVAASTGPAVLSTNALTFLERGVAQPVTLTNQSASPLVINSILLSSTNWTQTNNCGSVLSANSVCTIQVTANPNSVGVFTGRLTVSDGDTTTNQTVTLSSDVAYTTVYTFPTTTVGQGSTTNNGSYTFNGGVYEGTMYGYSFYDYSATLTGPAPNDFVGVPSYCSTKSSTYCTLVFYMNPQAAGLRLAKVTTNAGEHFLFKGTGVTVARSFTLSPSRLSYYTTAVGSSSGPSQSFLLTNNGASPEAYSFTSSSSEFSAAYPAYNTCPMYASFNQAYQATCEFAPVFKPSGVGTRTATVTVKELTSGYTQTVTLYGQGTGGPTAPYYYAFGNVAVGSTANTTVTAVIPSQHAATASISGSNSPFSIPGSFFCAPGAATCSFTVAFTPTTGPAADSLVVTDLTTGYTSTTALSGYGGVPVASPSVSSLDFGVRNVGTMSVPQTFTVTNTGNAPLTVSSVSIAGTAATDYSQSNTCAASVAVGAYCSISVTNTPTAIGSRPASLVIASNGATVSLSLTSTGN